MIVLDTHIWVWLVSNDEHLVDSQRQHIAAHEASGLNVSIISCWEVAKLVELGRLQLDRPVLEWIKNALRQPGIRLVDLDPAIVVESTQLPGKIHRDPADQLIVATARLLGCPLLTVDDRLRKYEHVDTLS